MIALTKAGEAGIALENMCTQLFEYDAKVFSAVIGTIKALAQAMKFNEKYWRLLERLEPPLG